MWMPCFTNAWHVLHKCLLVFFMWICSSKPRWTNRWGKKNAMSNGNSQPLILVTSMENNYKLSKVRCVSIIFFIPHCWTYLQFQKLLLVPLIRINKWHSNTRIRFWTVAGQKKTGSELYVTQTALYKVHNGSTQFQTIDKFSDKRFGMVPKNLHVVLDMRLWTVPNCSVPLHKTRPNPNWPDA